MFYILEDDTPVPVDIKDPRLEKIWSDIKHRRIALDQVTSKVRVSTVFLCLDHNFEGSGDPVLFETMIFGGKLDDYQVRARTKQEALDNHRVAVEMVKSRKIQVGGNE